MFFELVRVQILHGRICASGQILQHQPNLPNLATIHLAAYSQYEVVYSRLFWDNDMELSFCVDFVGPCGLKR